jgi:hypothetical protein
VQLPQVRRHQDRPTVKLYDNITVTTRELALYDCYDTGCDKLAPYVVSYAYVALNGYSIITRRRMCERGLEQFKARHTRQLQLPGFEP